jgi:hypothetical protein
VKKIFFALNLIPLAHEDGAAVWQRQKIFFILCFFVIPRGLTVRGIFVCVYHAVKLIIFVIYIKIIISDLLTFFLPFLSFLRRIPKVFSAALTWFTSSTKPFGNGFPSWPSG